ncbi:MAG: DUF3990 domain-containing protein [Elusimicrobiota bacterium]|jgi:hypothetical protein|nr:DUF3990 domain-containing protein [Elusimicrobiota bacterium]
MNLYHGTNADFNAVSLSFSKDKRDFGKGFYTTMYKEQADSWSKIICFRFRGLTRYVYEFELNITNDLKVKHFETMNNEWLEFVGKNRIMGGIQHNFDIVIGPVANDNTSRTIELYVDGIYSADVALQKLRYFKTNNQVSIHTEAALRALKLINRDSYEK